jgi:regulator of protease activity HflC (stomatin/prohibitin superfamily)
LSARIVKQYEQGVLFRLGRVQGPRNLGFRLIISFIDVQLRNLQSLVEIGVDKNTTVVFPAPLMTTIAELGSFLAREQAAASPPPLTTAGPIPPPAATANGTAMS